MLGRQQTFELSFRMLITVPAQCLLIERSEIGVGLTRGFIFSAQLDRSGEPPDGRAVLRFRQTQCARHSAKGRLALEKRCAF